MKKQDFFVRISLVSSYEQIISTAVFKKISYVKNNFLFKFGYYFLNDCLKTSAHRI